MKRYLKSGFNTIQDIKLEAGTYTLVLYVKNMYSNVYTFALGDGIDWMEYDVDVIQGKLCKVWVTFTTIRGATKFKPIARNYSLEFPVYVADLQLTRGNVPVEAGASPFDVDQILDDLHDDIDGIEDFTNEAFRDGLLDREEKTQLRSSLDAIGSIVESVKGSYDKLLDNPFISNNTMTSITNRYYDFIASWLSDGDPRGLKPVILWIVNGDNIISVEERDEKNRALSAFNVALYKYNQAEKEIYNDIGDNSIAPIIIDGFWAFWNPKKWNVKTNTYGDFEKSKFSAEGDDGHSPYVDVLTKTWWEWDPNLWNPFTNKYGDYWDTGVRAEGLDAKLIDIQSTPTAITVKGDQSSSPWIFISATTENTYTDIDSWKFFIDDLVVEDKTSIAFYNGQEHFWVVKVYDMLELYPDIKSLGVSVKSMDEIPITKSIDIPVVREGTDGLNTATVYLYKRIPEGVIKLWSSTGTFIFNEDEIPQEGEWTEPAVIIDTPDFEVVFSSSPTTPGEPYGHPNQNSDWVNIADETTTWMATSKLENEEWSPWEVSKTKDDNNLEFTVFTRSDVYPGRPEGGTYADPFPETPGWSSGIPRSIIYPIRETLTYSFIDKKFIAGSMNGWSLNIPNGSEQLYVIGATTRSRFDIDEIFPNEWSEMVEMGKDGFNSASITLYQRKKTIPSVPQSDCEYTFSTGNLTNFEEEGWFRSVPNGKDKLWVTTATAISTFASDTIRSTEWAYPTIMAEDGQGSLKSTAFIRSNEEPKTPTGGDYMNPNPEFVPGIEEEWSDGIPSGDKRLWASTRIFTSDGLKPQQDVWTTPEVMADSAGFDVEFSSEEEPGIPGGPPNDGVEKNPNWSNTADETTIWMATSNFKDGEWSQWTISKIKGEKGEKGDSGTSISIKGTVANPSELEELTPGDIRYLGRGYISEDTGDLWLFDGVTEGVYLDKDKIERYATFGWANVGKIQGDSNYIHIAWADNVEFNLDGKFESIDGFTLEDTNKKRWYGLYVDDIKEDALEINAHKYNWVDTKGEAGKDSKSDEYIYIRNNNRNFSAVPPSEPDIQDYVPEHLGWTDDPVGVDETHLYEWVSKRKFRENEDGEMEWGTFSTPSIWGIFVTDGEDGKDSKSDEYIYRRTSNPGFGIADNRPPNKPQEDDYVPRHKGWTDDPQGVTELEQYEFVSKRIFRNDVWSDFSTPSLWAKWSQDAKNPYADYDRTIGGQYNDGKKYWFVWDALEKKYVNSGDPSQGDDGNQPRINSEGFWEVWGDTGDGTLGYVATTIKARGEDGVSSFKSVVFKRYNPTTSKPTPDTPRASDGSYAKPVPTGWSDGVPNGDGVLWASTRVFAENGATPPQQDVWTTPEVMADSAGFDVEFSSIEINPGDPTKNPGNWSNTADETTIWMATSNLENGIWSKWSIAKIKGEGGKDGLHGVNTATIYLYKRYSGLKTDIPMPINTLTYNFTNEELTGTTNGWYRNIPAGSNQLYVIGATASSRADTDKIYANEWSDAVELATDGFNSASITLYQRKATIPNVPINNCVYTFKSGTLTNFTQQGWYRGVPTSEANTKLWVTTATAISTEPTDVITSSEWADPTVMAEDGKGISEVKDFYGLSSIETSEPTKWFSYIPNKAVDEYLWNYEEIIYTDGNSIETKKRIIQGKDARSIKSVVNAYAYSSSDTVSPTSGWMSTIESLGEKPDGYFLWVRDDITYTDGTSSSTKGYVVKDGKDSYSVTLSKDSHTYTYDKDGNLKGYLSDGATTISVQRGDIFFKCDTTSIGYVPVNNNTYRVVAISVAGVSYSSATRAIVNNEFKIWPSAFTGETGSLTFTIRAMSDGVVSKDFKKTISFSKNRDGKDGQPGGNGLPGQIPIKKEWKLNDLHRNNDDVVDYIYYRGVNAEASYWYKLKNKGDRNNNNYSTPLPNNSTFKSLYESIDWLKALAVDVLLAEEANVAGFIFKDNQLISEKGLLDGVVKKYGEIEDERKDDFIPNIILDGGEGNVKITGDVNATSGLIGGMIIKDGNLISTRGKSYDDEEVVYGEYTQYQFNTSPLVSPPHSSHETWTDLPSTTTNATKYIQYKKNTETQWTQVRVGISSGRWTVKYAETPNASIWDEKFAPNRIWMQIKVGGEPTARKAVKIDITSGYDFIPNFTIDGARGTMKITGEINATSGTIGGMSIAGDTLVSQNGKIVVDGRSNQIYLKDPDSDAVRTILSPRKLPLTPSSYFGSSSTTTKSLGNLKRTYTQNSSSTVNLIIIPSGDSSAYQITIPPITMSVDVNHPGGGGGIGEASLPNIAEMRVEIYKNGIFQYYVSSVSAMSFGEPDSQTFTNEPKSYTIQGSGTWSVRVTHVHTINKLPSGSEGKVTNIDENAIVAKVVNSSAIGSNGMIIATSGTEYTYMVGDTYEVRRGNVGFKITSSGVYKSPNMQATTPTWNPI